MRNWNEALKGALLCGCAAGALGISTPASAEAAAASEKASTLEEVVVTAQRRAERLEDVPMIVTAITAQAVENRGIRNLQELGQAVAGVQINFSGFATQPSVRGVSSLTTNVGFENNVALYIDGFYQDDTSTINADFANLESLQVLKGPQGTLYGRNATGGAFLLTTLQPSKTLTGKIDFKYASYKDRTLSAYISGPITDRIRFSLAGYGRKSDGYYDLLDATGREKGDAAPTASYSVRTKLQADVTDDLTVTLAYNFTQLEDPRGVLFNVEKYRSAALPPKVGQLYDPRTFATNRDSAQFNIVDEGTVTVIYKTPIGTISSYTGGAHRRIKQVFDFDGSYLDLSFSNVRFTSDSFQQGLDYNIDAVKNLNLILGGTYWGNRVKTRYSETYSGNRLGSVGKGSGITKAWALFADATYNVTDKLVLNVGGRYASEQKKARNGTILFPSQVYAAGSPVGSDRLHATFHNFSPRVSVRYEVAPDSNVYASVSKGFRTGLVQQVTTPAGVVLLPIKPEKITAYEVGFKTARSNYRFDTAAYYYDYTNLQVGITIPNPLAPNSPINVVSNAKKAKIYGVEAQVVWDPIDHLELNLGAAYTHARYTDFQNATANGFNAAGNGGTGSNVTGQIQDWSGHQMARAPGFTAVLGADYEFLDVVGGSLKISTNVKYTDSYVTNNPSLYGNSPEDVARNPAMYPNLAGALGGKQRYRQPGYTLVNTSANWTDPTEHYIVGVFVNNLTNKNYHLSLNGGAFGDYGTWAPRRTYGVRLGYKY